MEPATYFLVYRDIDEKFKISTWKLIKKFKQLNVVCIRAFFREARRRLYRRHFLDETHKYFSDLFWSFDKFEKNKNKQNKN